MARIAILGATALTLASCAGGQSRYGAMRDSKPHAGVARAMHLPVHGIDVSKWQGRIDWASVRGAGTRFAYIKATEGGDHLDARFMENWEGARRAGVLRGAYHFMSWCRPATEQAAWFRQSVPNDPSALPPVLDVEWNPQSRTCPRKVTREFALASIRLVLMEMERHTGKTPIIYTDINFHNDILDGHLPQYPHWVRSTAAEPHERYRNRPFLMWQYTTTGKVPGIEGHVDRNAFNGTEADWADFIQAGRAQARHHVASRF